MIQRIIPLIAMLALSGCAITTEQQQKETTAFNPKTNSDSETITTIKSMEASLNTRLDIMEAKIETQNSSISELKKELSNVSKELLLARNKQKKNQNTTKQRAKQKENSAPAPSAFKTTNAANVLVLGSIENVKIANVNQLFSARIDTGATTSSLNAIDLEEFERNGTQWVRFHLLEQEKKADGELEWIEAPVIRFVKIRQSTTEKFERRPVIELWVKLGSIHEKTQFTLADRSHMTYPVLLGREFIQDIAIVDVSKKFVESEKN